MAQSALSFLEFFAGGGLARLGLERAGWRCVFANDWDEHKCAVYRDNFGAEHLHEGDVWTLPTETVAAATGGKPADLAWASFPCQDLSLAGARAGLNGERSSAFHGFWRVVEALSERGQAPRCLVLENVTGLLTSHEGADFAAIVEQLTQAGYVTGALVLDAAAFTPQSRPRVFITAIQEAALARMGALRFMGARPDPHGWGVTPSLVTAVTRLSLNARKRWVWWRLPAPAVRNTALEDVLETAPWWSDERTQALLAHMHLRQRQTIDAALAAGKRLVGAVYRRVRVEEGVRVQRAEARFDGLAGCLRTPSGGSSRQFILCVEQGAVRARALTPREAARLMGAPEEYRLPEGVVKALTVLGDGVSVPVTAHLAQHLLTPLLTSRASETRLAALAP